MTKLVSSLKYIFSLLGTALKGSEKEFTTGSINKAIFLLSIPMIAEMVMESLFAVVDIFFVSQVGVNAVATVGLTESVLMIIYSMAVGMSMAVTAIVARRIGEKKPEKAANAAFQGVLVATSIAVLLGIVGFFAADDILRLMGGEEDLIAQGSGYTQVMFAGNISIILIFLINGAFRGAGDASIAMRSLWLANILNMILDPILIFGWGPIPAFGVMGAAIATTTGRSIGVIYQLFHLFGGSSVLKLGWQNVVIKLKTIAEILKLSIGGMGQFLIESASWIFLVRVMSLFGAEALAGYTIAFRVIVFTILPSWGMANAAATLVGQNLGAAKPERAERSVWRTSLLNMVFLGLISILFYTLAQPILGLFTDEQVVIDIGISALRIICFGYIFFAFGMVISQAFNGAGDTRTPMVINVFVFWLIQIPLAYWLSVSQGWNQEGVFFSIAFAHSLHAIVCIVLFRRGTWKTVQV
ncbi:MAG: MATE family efflux transporter [Cyclobacteriaceae bacterium]|nr:MATE family efflux transporter [Cyclobacteriaceae bacterium HetDA_MAG_MS6]